MKTGSKRRGQFTRVAAIGCVVHQVCGELKLHRHEEEPLKAFAATDVLQLWLNSNKGT